jgi:hypothetical protein
VDGSRLSDGGISVDLPRGWDGHIRPAGQGRGPEPERGAGANATTPADPGGHPVPRVLHVASFGLPADRGDYGSGAVELMGGSDVLVCLLEHEPEATATALFQRTGVPRLVPSMFSPQTMQRALPGMAGAQQFFQVGGRAFCLYVVVGSWRTRGPLVRAADRVVASIEITS